MDSSFEDIQFNESGTCQYCVDFLETTAFMRKPQEERQKDFNHAINEIKRKGENRKYDCVVGISGGVDSSYIVHLCKEHKLRPLLIHLDNGWNTDISVKNISSLIESTGFDYVSIILDWEEFRAMSPDTLIEVMKSPQVLDTRNILRSPVWNKAPVEVHTHGFYAKGTI
jgi:3'-phosphoadenosine 5'-phosphosulfate sulfotransferase (PAPS reductase)/FAD synthetase